VEEVAKAHGVSMAQVALAWLLSKDGMFVTWVDPSDRDVDCPSAVVSAPIVGTTSLDKLHDIVGAVHLKLTEEEIKRLEETYKPQAIAGHW
jgi:aryl-alcohol dehydrogenase-like predicted oxidoreductase